MSLEYCVQDLEKQEKAQLEGFEARAASHLRAPGWLETLLGVWQSPTLAPHPAK